MSLQDEIERATARAEARREIERMLRKFPAEERRTLLLDIFVGDVHAGMTSAPSDVEHTAPTDVVYSTGFVTPTTSPVPHGSRANRTVAFLNENGGATVEEVALAIYGSDHPDARKKAASMLSLLRSGQGGHRVQKDDENDVWQAVDITPSDEPPKW